MSQKKRLGILAASSLLPAIVAGAVSQDSKIAVETGIVTTAAAAVLTDDKKTKKSFSENLAGSIPYGLGDFTQPYIFPSYNSPIYIPKKHTIQTYRSQQRAAKKRKRAR